MYRVGDDVSIVLTENNDIWDGVIVLIVVINEAHYSNENKATFIIKVTIGKVLIIVLVCILKTFVLIVLVRSIIILRTIIIVAMDRDNLFQMNAVIDNWLRVFSIVTMVDNEERKNSLVILQVTTRLLFRLVILLFKRINISK